MRFFAALIAGLALSLLPFLGLADQFEDGLAAARRGDYASAVRLWRPLAEKDDADAQYNLGLMFARGNGTVQDQVEAVRWFRKAAEHGHLLAEFNVGYAYMQGQGVPQDYAEAVRWYSKAAEAGEARAQLNLGVMYRRGFGVPQDFVQAYRWFNLAASGSGSESETIQQVWAVASTNREQLAKGMTATQIAEAQKLSKSSTNGSGRWWVWPALSVGTILIIGLFRRRRLNEPRV